jgi:hypothetical protein
VSRKLNVTNDEIVDALDRLLSAMIEHDKQRDKERSGTPAATPFQALTKLEDLPTRAESEIKALLKTPVRSALKQAVRRLGEVTFQVTSDLGQMQDIAEAAASRDDRHYGRRASIINSAWNGIGGWMS